MQKILFVCLGNICRSPMAEAIFNHKVKKLGLGSSVMAASAGTAHYHVGETPDPRTIETLEKREISISHLGQQFKAHHANEFDYLIAMDTSNKANMMLELEEENKDTVTLIGDYDPEEKIKDVPDPWYGGISGFENVYNILNRSIDGLISFLRKEHNL